MSRKRQPVGDAFPSGSPALYTPKAGRLDGTAVTVQVLVYTRTPTGNYLIGSGRGGLTIASPDELRPDTALERIALELDRS